MLTRKQYSPVLGFAFDGFPLYGPYESDGVMAKDLKKSAALDVCNGHIDEIRGYHYKFNLNSIQIKRLNADCLMVARPGYKLVRSKQKKSHVMETWSPQKFKSWTILPWECCSIAISNSIQMVDAADRLCSRKMMCFA